MERATGERPFLTARWENLLLLNFECPSGVLEPLVPLGTSLDPWEGRTLVSLVGFMFRDTRVRRVAVPGHRTFEEVNLRFYVRREVPGEVPRRGVVFVREFVPRRMIAEVARRLYNEPYLAVSMWNRGRIDPKSGGDIEYGWKLGPSTFSMQAVARGPASETASGSEGEFITEHYWGYTRQRDGGTVEYEVAHPRWRVWDAQDVSFSGDASELYGPALGEVLAGRPRSAFLALGSEVSVYTGRRLNVRT